MSKNIFLSFTLNDSSVSDYFVSLANKFVVEEFEVTVFTQIKRYESNSLHKNVVIKYWPSQRPTKLKDFIFLFNEIKRKKPILLISIFGSVNIFMLVGYLTRVKNRIAWIRTLSTQFPQKNIYVLRKSFIYRLATHVITNSKATKRDSSEVYKISESKIKILPNSVENYSTNLPLRPPDLSKIIYAGRLHPSKGIDVLINAFLILVEKKYDIYLDIYGSGIQEAELKKIVTNLDRNGRVHFLGNCSKKEVVIAFQNSLCVVVPSITEAFGFVAIEAMSAKTCVIGANNTGIKEIIKDNETGMLFETGNYLDLASKIESLLLDSKLRDELAKKGHERFLNTFEIGYAIDRDFKFFKGCILNEN